MPDGEEQEAAPPQGQQVGFGDVVIDNMARQLAQKSVDLAMAESRLLVQKQEFDQKADEMSKTIIELQQRLTELQGSAESAEKAVKGIADHAPSQKPEPPEVKHTNNGRTTEKVKSDG